MKGQVKLTDLQKDSIGMLYYCVKNGVEICEALLEDKLLDTIIRFQFVRIWLVILRKIKTQMDQSLGCNERFDDQIKKTDTMGLHDIVTWYIGMSPEGRSAVEDLFKAIKKDQEIQFEVR